MQNFVVYNKIIHELVLFSNIEPKFEIINDIQYLVSQKDLHKARIQLRAKIPIEFLNYQAGMFYFSDLNQIEQKNLSQQLKPHLLLSAQEIITLFYVFHLLLSNENLVRIKDFHQNFRGLNGLDESNVIDRQTLRAYKKALNNLKQKILHVNVKKCSDRVYGISFRQFTEPLITYTNEYVSINKLSEAIIKSEQYSELFMPKDVFSCKINQITKFLIAYEFSYEIYCYKTNNKNINFFEVNLITIMKKIPHFLKDGTNANINVYQHIKQSTSKTQIINRFWMNCIDVLNLYVKENIISSYNITPNIDKIGVKNLTKVKFCLKIR